MSTRVLGFAFAANTGIIVLSQLVVLKKLAGKRRTRAIATMALLWATVWLIVLVSNNAGIHWIAVVGAILGMATFALGETFMSPTLPAIVNDLAPDDLRGRYNALYSTSWAVGHIVGPAIVGVALGAELGNWFFSGLIVACLVAAYLAISLERYLPASANRVTASDVMEEPSPINSRQIREPPRFPGRPDGFLGTWGRRGGPVRLGRGEGPGQGRLLEGFDPHLQRRVGLEHAVELRPRGSRVLHPLLGDLLGSDR